MNKSKKISNKKSINELKDENLQYIFGGIVEPSVDGMLELPEEITPVKRKQKRS